MATQNLANLQNLGNKPSTRTVSWLSLVQRSWGDEYKAPDRGLYEFTGGRKFDSTDTGITGIYATNNSMGLLLDGGQYPDMPTYLLTESSVNADTRTQLDQN